MTGFSGHGSYTTTQLSPLLNVFHKHSCYITQLLMQYFDDADQHFSVFVFLYGACNSFLYCAGEYINICGMSLRYNSMHVTHTVCHSSIRKQRLAHLPQSLVSHSQGCGPTVTRAGQWKGIQRMHAPSN